MDVIRRSGRPISDGSIGPLSLSLLYCISQWISSCSDGGVAQDFDAGEDGSAANEDTFDASTDEDAGIYDAALSTDSGADAEVPFEKQIVEVAYHRFRTGITTLWADGDGFWVGTGRWGLLRIDAQGTVLEEYNRFTHPLPNDSILSFLIDSNGTVWMGTWNGVAVFRDGNFEIWDQDDEFLPGFTDGENDIAEIREDPQGNIWVYATVAGFGRFDGQDWTTFALEDGVPEDIWGGFAIDAQGEIWGSSQSGAYHFDMSDWDLYIESDGLVEPPIWDVEIDIYNRKWFSSWSGVSVLDDEGFKTFVPAPYCARLYADRQGRVFASVMDSQGEEDGIVQLPSGDPTGPGGPSRIDAVAEDAAGVLWFGQDQSLYRYDEADWNQQTIPYLANAPLGTRVNALDFDEQGNLWLATNNGVSRFDGVTWSHHTEDNGLPFNDVVDLNAVSENLVWIGTSVDGVARWNGENWTSYRRANSDISTNEINALTTDSNGVLWVATDDGVSRFDGQQWTNYSYVDGLPVDFATGIMVDGKGQIWIRRKMPIPGIDGYGVSRFDGQSWRSFTSDDGLPSNTVTSMVTDEQDRIWLCTTEGVTVFDGQEWSAPSFSGALPERHFTSMAIDAVGIMWFSESYDIFKYDGEKLIQYSTEDGLRDIGVGGLVCKSNGEMWFSTKGGVGMLVEKTSERRKVKWEEHSR